MPRRRTKRRTKRRRRSKRRSRRTKRRRLSRRTRRRSRRTKRRSFGGRGWTIGRKKKQLVVDPLNTLIRKYIKEITFLGKEKIKLMSARGDNTAEQRKIQSEINETTEFLRLLQDMNKGRIAHEPEIRLLFAILEEGPKNMTAGEIHEKLKERLEEEQEAGRQANQSLLGQARGWLRNT